MSEQTVQWREDFRTMPAPAGLQGFCVWPNDGGKEYEVYGPFPIIAMGFRDAGYTVTRGYSSRQEKGYRVVELSETNAGIAAQGALDEFTPFSRAFFYVLNSVDGQGEWLADGDGVFTNEGDARDDAAAKNRGERV